MYTPACWTLQYNARKRTRTRWQASHGCLPFRDFSATAMVYGSSELQNPPFGRNKIGDNRMIQRFMTPVRHSKAKRINNRERKETELETDEGR